ncbi:hypothetical protein KY326_02270, partial [Candidatus Woesearchaeota archaeon]|nr:hypothetical protein [Candidatus Woesearchaeota archaeon]
KDAIYFEDEYIEYRKARTNLLEDMKKYVNHFLERPSDIELVYELYTDEFEIKKNIKDAERKIERNRRFNILGSLPVVSDIERELFDSIDLAEEKLEYISRSRKNLAKIKQEVQKYQFAMENRDTTIKVEKPEFEFTRLFLDNPYLKSVGSEYVQAVRSYIAKQKVWIQEDADRRSDEIIEKHKRQMEIEKLEKELELKRAEVKSLQKEGSSQGSTYSFDLITWMQEQVVSPGDDRLHEAKQIISGNSKVFGGKIMRLGERLLSEEFESLIDSYIQNPKHNYRSDQEFRKGLALGIVEAINSPGEISQGIAAGVYSKDKLQDLAQKIKL